MAFTPVLVAPHFDPTVGRESIDVPEGLTLAQIVDYAMPGLAPSDRAQLRVTVASPAGAYVVPHGIWAFTRPKTGMQVILRLIPSGDGARAVLSAVVAIGAIALGQFWAGQMIATAGLGQSLLATGLAAGLSVVGNMLVNALVPAQQVKPLSQSAYSEQSAYSINGWSNTARPGEPVPYVLGRMRMAPPFAATSYTEIYGDDQYVRALFCFGYGPLSIEDIRIGDVSIDDYEDVQIEVREGYDDDDPVTRNPRQGVEDPDAGGVELVREYPRTTTGTADTAQEAVESPIVRSTATNATACTVIIGFPQGLFTIDDDGDRRLETVDVRIRQRQTSADAWEEVETLTISAHRRELFYRAHTWDLPSRGRWQIEVTRMTPESVGTKKVPTKVSTTALAALQSHRPEYPIAFGKPLALVAVRVRATHQLNGQLDNLNALVSRVAPTWDGTEWIDGSVTRNPAAAMLHALRGPMNPFPATDAEIDWDALQTWYDFCEAKGLSYDFIHEVGEPLGDVLRQIGAAGRANPRHDGLRWTVVIDAPSDLVVDELSPRNASSFQWTRTYFDPPHAFRVPFYDETNNYEMAERIVPWPGYEGSIDLTETLELPGKTNPDEVWIEARRRQYELLHRADELTCVQSGMARTATRGDQVAVSIDMITRTQIAARVREVRGALVVLDTAVEMVSGADYGIRFRVFDEADTVGQSVVRSVQTVAGQRSALRVLGEGDLPEVGMLVHFGEIETESHMMRIRAEEAGAEMSRVFRLVPAAPEIDALTDAEVPPAWDAAIGDALDLSTIVPAVPYFSAILSGSEQTAAAGQIIVTMAPGYGSAGVVDVYLLSHRLSGATTWTTVEVSAASATAVIDAYAKDNVVELTVEARSADGTLSGVSDISEITVGATDIPEALSDVAITPGYGTIAVSCTAPEDALRAGIRVLRGATSVVSLATDVSGLVSIAASGSVTFNVGTAQPNLIINGAFNSVSNWQFGDGWSVASGEAVHTPPDPVVDGALIQSVSLVPGKTYVWSLDVTSEIAAGNISVELRGDGSDVEATSGTGSHFGELTAPVNPTSIAYVAGAFEGAFDNASLRVASSSSLDAGLGYFWVLVESEAGVRSTPQGPFLVAVR
jgi:predicted phage tail protein